MIVVVLLVKISRLHLNKERRGSILYEKEKQALSPLVKYRML
jgi:hypothetical protein